MTFQDSLNQAIREVADWQRDNLEAFIISYFGSEERARECAKYFVIEEDEMRMEVDQEIYNPHTMYRMTHTYRIRPKTPEELAHDRAEEILKDHTTHNCIVCGEPVIKANLVESRHGAYHTWCVEGRQ